MSQVLTTDDMVRDQTIRLGGLVGMAAGLADDRRILAMTARGLRHMGRTEPVTIADRWHIGSITKSLTTILIGTLVSDARLDVDAPLPALLPDMPQMDAGWQDITLRDVLENRGGLPTDFGAKTMQMAAVDEAARPALRRAALAEILAEPPKPRAFLYSNVGFTLAGHVVENITGLPWEQALREAVFAPLGLKTAGFGAPMGSGFYDQPWGHRHFLGFWRRAVNPLDSRADNTPVIGPAGTVHMSLADLLTYGQALLRMARGGDDILPAALFTDLTTPRSGDNVDGYAGGLVLGHDPALGGGYLWHNGSNGVWYALLLVLPAKNRVIAVTTNQYGKRARALVEQVSRQLAGDGKGTI